MSFTPVTSCTSFSASGSSMQPGNSDLADQSRQDTNHSPSHPHPRSSSVPRSPELNPEISSSITVLQLPSQSLERWKKNGTSEDGIRRRLPRACEACRKDKVRCESQRPCHLCRRRNIECITSSVTTLPRRQNTAPKKRSLHQSVVSVGSGIDATRRNSLLSRKSPMSTVSGHTLPTDLATALAELQEMEKRKEQKLQELDRIMEDDNQPRKDEIDEVERRLQGYEETIKEMEDQIRQTQEEQSELLAVFNEKKSQHVAYQDRRKAQVEEERQRIVQDFYRQEEPFIGKILKIYASHDRPEPQMNDQDELSVEAMDLTNNT